MILRYCPCCGKKVIPITTKTALYKAVCLDCEMTFKGLKEVAGKEAIQLATSSPSQMTEAVMNKK